MRVEQLIDEVIGREGGYSNHPADTGGATRWGVTEQVARAHGYGGDMRIFPREKAVDIYRRVYWTKPGFDRVYQIYPKVAAEMFDTGVNMGPMVAASFLQRALNALNRGAKDYRDLVNDGDIGAVTIAALIGFREARGIGGEDVLVRALNALQGERYISLSEKRPANEAFLYGWLAHRL